MFETPEEVKEYCRAGSRMNRDFYRQVSALLLAERLNNRRMLDELSKSTGVPANLIEKQELRRKKMNWCLIATLLKFYKKKLVVSFEDDVGTAEK